MSTRLVEATARVLENRLSRRGFLRRAAIVGSALATAPATYVLRKGTAYAAFTTNCPDCSGAALCCDGWSEFCCTLHGTNTCPPGTVVAGWWRAEWPGTGPDHCQGAPRYYLDCNSASCTCGCNASGTCSHACVGCTCECADGECTNRKACCARFRYGQCNQQEPCLGPIECRVVTCVPPWEWDSSCTRTDARAQTTWSHDAACLRPSTAYPARPATVTGTTWRLRDSLSSGPAATTYQLGQDGDVFLMGDWTGAGVATPCTVRGVRYGPVADADDVASLTWYIGNIEGGGRPDNVFTYGRAGDIPVAGDWNGDGVTTVGVVRGNQWLLRNSNSSGPSEVSFTFGNPGDIPVVGRWTDAGIDLPGMVRGTTWMLRNQLGGGSADIIFDFGSATDRPVVGDWTDGGRDLPGRFDDGEWQLRNSLTAGPADQTFTFGGAGDIPLVWGRV